jgi:prepilin-type N-terminal cleavage/methylation domain-containing protein
MRSRGFTLIELLVALTLFGVIATMVASGTRLSLDLSARGNKRAESIRKEQMQLGFLRNQLQGALPFRYWTVVETDRMEHAGFEGESGRIRFISRDGLLDGPGSLPRWVELRKQDAPGGLVKIVLEERRILPPDNQPGETVTAQTEIPACDEAHFEYLDTIDQQLKWSSGWNGIDHSTGLPFAVRIQCKSTAEPMNILISLEYAESARLGLRIQ